MEEYRVDLTPSQIADLQTLVAGQVSTNESVLDQHGRDESAFPPVRPSAVVMASTTEEVSRVLKYCNEQRIPVVAFGAGSSLEGHAGRLRSVRAFGRRGDQRAPAVGQVAMAHGRHLRNDACTRTRTALGCAVLRSDLHGCSEARSDGALQRARRFAQGPRSRRILRGSEPTDGGAVRFGALQGR